MSDYTSAIRVDAPALRAYEAILDVQGWWSQEVVGQTDQVDGEFDYRYGDVHRCRIRVTELVPGRTVAWLVLENRFDFTRDQSEWTGTRIVFDILEQDGGAEVRFRHLGLVPQYECYDVCSNAWHGYLHGSLKQLIETGTGQPNPKDGAPVPPHQDAAVTVRSAVL